MEHKFTLIAVCAVCVGLFTDVKAQEAFTLIDANTGTQRVFTVTLGVADTNAPLVVFEGQLDADLSVNKAFHEASGLYLASVRLLAQIRLYDEFPVSNEVGAVQGAVVALRSPPLADTGLYFAWGASNSVMTWLPLMQTNGTQFAVNDGNTNYVTFIFNYPTNSDPVTYQVFVGLPTDAELMPSEPIGSYTAETNGINSVSLMGIGGVEEIATASGAPGPLSSAIGLNVYYASNNVCADVYTVNESGTNPIKLYAWIDGAWVLVGTVNSVYGSGDHKYHIILTGLTPGLSYLFRVEDEIGRVYELNQPYEVKTITIGEAFVETVTGLEMRMLTVTFNTEANRRYQVKISQDLTAPAGDWTVEDVYLDSIGGFTNIFTAAGSQTQIRVPLNKNKAYFRVIQVED